MYRKRLPYALALTLLVFGSCGEKGDTGPQGIQGPEGPDGPAGPQGPDGSAAIVFQEGGAPTAHYAGTRDTYINSGDPTRNYGGGTAGWGYFPGQIEVGNWAGSHAKRGLIRFDVSEIVPSNGSVSSAYLVLYAPSCGGRPTVGAYELTQSWDEGTGDGSGDGYANWQNRFAGTTWAAPGGSYNSVLLDSETVWLDFPKRSSLLDSRVIASGEVPTACVFEIPASTVQNWMNNPAENYGLLLKVVDENIAWGEEGGGAVIFTGREWTEGGQRPKLIVYYRLP